MALPKVAKRLLATRSVVLTVRHLVISWKKSIRFLEIWLISVSSPIDAISIQERVLSYGRLCWSYKSMQFMNVQNSVVISVTKNNSNIWLENNCSSTSRGNVLKFKSSANCVVKKWPETSTSNMSASKSRLWNASSPTRLMLPSIWRSTWWDYVVQRRLLDCAWRFSVSRGSSSRINTKLAREWLVQIQVISRWNALDVKLSYQAMMNHIFACSATNLTALLVWAMLSISTWLSSKVWFTLKTCLRNFIKNDTG